MLAGGDCCSNDVLIRVISLSLSLSLTDDEPKRPKSLAERWNDVIRRVELWVDIMELNDQGEYVPVEIQSKADVRTGGVYQIRQVLLNLSFTFSSSTSLSLSLSPSPSLSVTVFVCHSLSLSLVCSSFSCVMSLFPFQGQSRRIMVKVVPIPNSGNGPLVCDSISSMSVGSVYLRNRYDEPLDSYQEQDLER